MRVPHPCVFCKGGRRCCVCYLIWLRTRDKLTWCRHFRLPPFAKSAKDGAPACVGKCPQDQKPGPPASGYWESGGECVNAGADGRTPLFDSDAPPTFFISTAESALAGIAVLAPVGSAPAPAHKKHEPQLSYRACGTYLHGQSARGDSGRGAGAGCIPASSRFGITAGNETAMLL